MNKTSIKVLCQAVAAELIIWFGFGCYMPQTFLGFIRLFLLGFGLTAFVIWKNFNFTEAMQMAQEYGRIFKTDGGMSLMEVIPDVDSEGKKN